MSTRRVILGNLGDGTFGLRVSLPGHDVVTEGSNPDSLSFDSGWTDIVKMIQVGVATTAGAGAVGYVDVLFPDPGYIPFAEVRQRSGNRVYDDYFTLASSNNFQGIGASILSDRLRLPNAGPAYDVVYAIFRVPVPAP